MPPQSPGYVHMRPHISLLPEPLNLGIVGARSWGAAPRCARLYVDGRPSGQADSQGGPASVTTVIGPHLLCTVCGREEEQALGCLYLLSIS